MGLEISIYLQLILKDNFSCLEWKMATPAGTARAEDPAGARLLRRGD